MQTLVGVLAALLALAALAAVIFGRRAARRSAAGVDPDRRSFLNRVLLGSLGVFSVAFGGASIAMLWPEPIKGGPGGKVFAGRLEELRRQFDETGPVYNIEGRFYIVRYETSDPENIYVKAGVVVGGLMALFQKCSHLGCRVPFCSSSQWFECPCHDARFNLAGEVRNGPAPAGLWRLPIEITDRHEVIVDTSRKIAQPPAGTDTTKQQPAGDFCVRG